MIFALLMQCSTVQTIGLKYCVNKCTNFKSLGLVCSMWFVLGVLDGGCVLG